MSWVRLNLTDFFLDHRKSTRVYIKSTMKIMKDLYDHIAHVFDINSFILDASGDYLPEMEDIEILNKQEIINVIRYEPGDFRIASTKLNNMHQLSAKKCNKKYHINHQQTIPIAMYQPTAKKTNRFNALDTATSPMLEIPEANYNRAQADDTNAYSVNIVSVNDNEGDLQQENLSEKVLKLQHSEPHCTSAKRNRPNNYITSETNLEINSQNKNQEEETKSWLDDIEILINKTKNKSEKYNCSDRTEQLNSDSYSASTVSSSKKQTETSRGIKVNNSKKNHSITSPPRDIITFSKHVDTSNCRKFKPPERITTEYLSNRKINIVKVDIIRPVNYDTVNVAEKEKISELTYTEPKEVDKFINSNSLNCEKSANGIQTCSENTDNIEEHKVNESLTIKDNSEHSIELNGSTTAAFDTDDSQQVIAGNICSSLSINTKKRKRTRKRKHTRKNDPDHPAHENRKLEEIRFRFSQDFRPALHLKFPDDEECNVKSEIELTDNNVPLDSGHTSEKSNNDIRIGSDDIQQGDCAFTELTSNKRSSIGTAELEKTNIKQNIVEKEVELIEDWSKITDEFILNQPLIGSNRVPEMNDIIAFKTLKMGENYNPELSNFIVGKVAAYTPNGQNISFLILRGETELIEPIGKFSMAADNETYPIVRENFIWTSLHDTRLLKH